MITKPSTIDVPVVEFALYRNYRSEGILVPQVVDFLQARNGMSFDAALALMESFGHQVIRGDNGVQVEEEPGTGILHFVHRFLGEDGGDCIGDLLELYGMKREQLEKLFRSSAKTYEYKKEWFKGKPAENAWFKKNFPFAKKDKREDVEAA